MIYQSEAAECGLACLAMMAGHYGLKLDLPALRSRYPVSLKGANLQQLMQLADQLQLAPRALKLELDEIKQLRMPCILHWNMNHFVVLLRVRRQGALICDPAQGQRLVPLKELDQSFTGIALELTPTAEFQPKDERQSLGLNSFWQQSAGLGPALAKLLLLSLILQLFLLAAPYYSQLVVDEVLVSHDTPLLLVLALGFGLLLLLQNLTFALRSWVVLHLSSSLNLQMATNLFRHLLHLPVSFFEKRHMGDIVSRFGSLDSIREQLSSSLVEAVVDGVMALSVLLMMYLYSPKLAMVVCGAVLLYALLRLALYKPLKYRTEASIVSKAKEQSHFMETVRGIQTLQLFGQQSNRLSQWQNCYADAVNQQYRLGCWQIGYSTAQQLLFGLENILVVYLAAWAVLQTQMTVGMLLAFLAYKNQFSSRTAALIDRLIELRMVSLHLQRLADISLTAKEQDGGDASFRAISGQLQLHNLSFRYAATEPLLFQNLQLQVAAGEHIAIVGPSGCGKTSLLKLMLGLAVADSGSVTADSIDIRHLGLKHYRAQVAAVMQDDQLLNGSLADNICAFDSRPDWDLLVHCAVLAGIHQDIVQMPMGYNALVGDMGSSLSGGQKQRVLLARALYRKPKILFLDEASSQLDSAIEQQINKAIGELQLTRIVIAHRPQTILNADRVYLLERGKLSDVTACVRQQLQHNRSH
ncbi:peptidase domain-containing ABC transporter [Rheinheimera marina]|uniref:Peptidase domain-containing ABC transporter n=1 Tax=Rheinheimera marina TaxID=1774958 RepID=A0ABV9JJ13_9GAMM